MFLGRFLHRKLSDTPNRPRRRIRLELMRLEERCVPSVDMIHHFAGMNETGAGFVTPPDSDVAAGPKYVIHTTNALNSASANQGFEILTKSGKPVVEENINQFFHVPPSATTTDPRVIFNNIDNRFLVVLQESDAAGNFYFLDYAISNDANPLDGFQFFKLTVAGPNGADKNDTNTSADYPTLGFNAGGFFVTLNMFDNHGNFDHVQIVSITPSGKAYQNDRPFQQDFTLDPVRWHTSTNANVEWFVENDMSEFNTDVGGILRFVQMTNPFSNSPTYHDSTVTVPPFVDASFTSIVAPTQPPGGPAVAIGKVDSRMIDAAMQGNTLVSTQTVSTIFTQDVTNLKQYADRVRWYQFQMPTQAAASPLLQQSGDIAPSGAADIAGLPPPLDASTYTPAIEIAPNGNIGVTFLESSSLEFVSMYITGRRPADSSGTMETPVLVARGNTTNAFDGRIGDNAGMSLDPVNGSFWAANERYFNNGFLNPNWQTWIANFALRGPSPSPGPGGHGHDDDGDHGHGHHGGSPHAGDDDDDGNVRQDDRDDLSTLGIALQQDAHRLDWMMALQGLSNWRARSVSDRSAAESSDR